MASPVDGDPACVVARGSIFLVGLMVFLVDHDQGQVGSGGEHRAPTSTRNPAACGHTDPRLGSLRIGLPAVDPCELREVLRETVEDLGAVADFGDEDDRSPRRKSSDHLGDNRAPVLAGQDLETPGPRPSRLYGCQQFGPALITGEEPWRRPFTRSVCGRGRDSNPRWDGASESAPARNHVTPRHTTEYIIERGWHERSVDHDTFQRGQVSTRGVVRHT